MGNDNAQNACGKDSKAPPPSALVLGIETSCDETAAAVVASDRRVLSNVVHSQIDLHVVYGGVVPEIASRAHTEKISTVVREALRSSGVSMAGISAIAATHGPGLVGALLVGVNFAKGLAFACGKPLYGINHIQGHIAGVELSNPALTAPYLCLVVSGGHSHLLHVRPKGELKLIGCTHDDAAGEAFDKAARVLGLQYPGGPLLDQLAQHGDENRFALPVPKVEGAYDYSFSGLKTAFINLCHQMKQRGEPLPKADLAASFRKAVVQQLLDKAMPAMDALGETRLALAGGVSANRLLRESAQARCHQAGYALYMPELNYCGDNAAMIAQAAFSQIAWGKPAGLDLNADPTLRLF